MGASWRGRLSPPAAVSFHSFVGSFTRSLNSQFSQIPISEAHDSSDQMTSVSTAITGSCSVIKQLSMEVPPDTILPVLLEPADRSFCAAVSDKASRSIELTGKPRDWEVETKLGTDRLHYCFNECFVVRLYSGVIHVFHDGRLCFIISVLLL